MTSSVMTRMPRLCASSMNRSTSCHRAVARMHALVVGDVIPVVAQRRGIEGEDPQGVDAEPLQVVELLRQPGKVADAVVVAVEEGADVRLVDDRVLVPERIMSIGDCRLAIDGLVIGGLAIGGLTM